jgi:hypothetical protein
VNDLEAKNRNVLLGLLSSGPLIITLAFCWRYREQPEVAAMIFAIGLLVTFGVARTAWLGSWWTARTWQSFAERNGYGFRRGFDSEPQIWGERDGVAFRVSVASPRIVAGSGHYTRTYGTAAIPEGVPSGLRVYRRTAPAWVSEYSGLREIPTGVEVLDELFFVEGDEQSTTLDFVGVPGRDEVIVALGVAWPGVMIFGRDDDGPPIVVDEKASGAITIVESGRRPARKLDRMIDALVTNAVALSRSAAPASDDEEAESEQ